MVQSGGSRFQINTLDGVNVYGEMKGAVTPAPLNWRRLNVQ